MDHSHDYAIAMGRLAAIFEDAVREGERSRAVSALSLIRDVVRSEVQGIHAIEDSGDIEYLRMRLYENMRLEHLLSSGWGVDLLSTGGVPDDLDWVICRTLVDVYLDLGSVMDGYDLHKRAHGAVITVGDRPTGAVVLGALEIELGVSLLTRRFGEESQHPREESVGLDELVNAMFRRRDEFSDYSYWTKFVELALVELGLVKGRGGDWVEMAFRQLDKAILPFAGAIEVPHEVAMAYAAVPEYRRLRRDVEDAQRRFMRALVIATDPAMLHRTCTIQSLREAGLPAEEPVVDPEDLDW